MRGYHLWDEDLPTEKDPSFKLLQLEQVERPRPNHSTQTRFTFVGKITDGATGSAIDRAKVSLAAEGVPEPVYSDSEGFFEVNLPSTPNKSARLLVSATGYRDYERIVAPGDLASPNIHYIQLRKHDVNP